MSVDQEKYVLDILSPLPLQPSEKATDDVDRYQRLVNVTSSIAALRLLEETRSEAKTVHGLISFNMRRIILQDIAVDAAYLGCGYDNIGLTKAEAHQLPQIES